MIKIDLITGFLGAGKTTFIKKYARYLLKKGEKIGIIENDFGAVNVDMMLLENELGDQCDLEMISGGCDQTTHQRRFKTKLIALGMQGYDRILIEPSGIFDMDEFFDVLSEQPLDQWYEIGNVIAIVDAKLETNLSQTSEYLLASQIANAGCILLSRIQEAENKDIQDTILHLQNALKRIHCPRQFQNEIVAKNWNDLSSDDFEQIIHSGYVLESYVKRFILPGEGYSSIYLLNIQLTEKTIYQSIENVFNDPLCGKVFRIKGFMQSGDQRWFEINATKQTMKLQPIQVGQAILIVIGEALKEEKIKSYFIK